jgi:1-deoxy-D-xylulose-5-phosphate reductoisomerase
MLAPGSARVLAGPEGLLEIAALPGVDVVFQATSGAAGLPATLEAVSRGRTVALANKESLVVGGPLLTAAAARSGATLLPVDSEHSALFQALQAGRRTEVRRLVLTASGGPFLRRDPATLEAVTPEEALRHPRWNMGRRITVDSATLMNKALEVIEARWLFDVAPDRIAVTIHPQSIVHSLVEFRDGSVIAQMGPPDMKVPIQYALTWPERLESPDGGFRADAFRDLTFEEPDPRRFPALDLGFAVAAAGGTSGAILNGADEEAVALFLAGRLAFPRIVPTVAAVLADRPAAEPRTLSDLLEADAWARAEVRRRVL